MDARQAVAKLEELGMFNEITGSEWGRLYLARPILRILEKAGAKPAAGS